MRKLFFLSLVMLVVPSCVPRYSVFEPLDLETEPIVEYYSDMNFDYASVFSFAVVPIRKLTNKTYDNYNPLAEDSISFSIRNIMELNGYQFSDSPDIVLLYLFSNKYEQSYIPPQQYTSFMYIPGKNVTTTTDFSGNINSITGWGSFSGTATTTTRTPATIMPYTFTTPGKTVGYYYPGVNIWVYDLRNEKIIWQGFAVGASKNSDIRVSSQVLLMKLLSNFPRSQRPGVEPPSGVIGVWVRVLTFDGNTFFPVIVDVDKGLPADRAGLKVGDIILKINNYSTINKSTSYIDRLLRGEAGSIVTLEIMRNNNTQIISVARAARK